MIVRRAMPEDIPELARLSAQLGYPVSERDFVSRLANYSERIDHIVLVAVEEERPVGFINGGVRHDLVYEAMVELMSLVVDADVRGRGVGRHLLAAFEDWVRGQGVSVIKLGSRDERTDAHRFYEREGYELEKVHYIYRKRL